MVRASLIREGKVHDSAIFDKFYGTEINSRY